MKPCKFSDRLRRLAYVSGSYFPPLWKGVAAIPLALMCKANGWRRDKHGRLYRPVRPSDPPTALFDGSRSIWFSDRCAGGERVLSWSYKCAWLFDVGAVALLMPAEGVGE